MDYSWEEAAFILVPKNQEGLPLTLILSLLILSFTDHIPYHPLLFLWCYTKSFPPGHCGYFGVSAPRFLTQKEAAVVCPTEGPLSSATDCDQRVPETCIVSSRLPSLPDDEVFLEEAMLVRMRSAPDSHDPLGLPTR